MSDHVKCNDKNSLDTKFAFSLEEQEDQIEARIQHMLHIIVKRYVFTVERDEVWQNAAKLTIPSRNEYGIDEN